MAGHSLVRNARKTSQLSQKALGARAGVAGSSLSQVENGKRVPNLDTVERLLRHAGHSLVTIPTMRDDAATVASQIADAVKSRREDVALRLFIQLNDNLVAEHNEARYGLGITEPAATGVKHWDAAMAGLVAYRLAEEGFPAPSWTETARRRLRRSWTFSAGRYVVPVARDRVPQQFLERGVLIDPETLVSV